MMVALKGLGFSSMNCILTLKNAGQMLFLNIVLIYVFFGKYLLAKYTDKTADKEKAEKLKKQLFFAPFLGISFRAFIPMSISSYLNITYQFGDREGYMGEKIADYYALVVGFLVCVFFPIAMLYVALVPKEWLESPDFKQKWGFLYNTIRTENFMQRAYFFMFILRRAILIYSGLAMYLYPC